VSIRYIAAVLDRLTTLTAPESLVLIALADFASDDTRECWPSVATISRRARLTRRGVQKILRRLEARDLIETAVGGGMPDGTNSASRYRLRFTYDGERLEIVEPKLSTRGSRKLSTRGNTVRGGANGGRGGGEPRSPNPSLIRHRTKERLKNAEIVDKSRERGAQSLVTLLEELRKRGEEPKA
jgi:hypothetical protein